MALPPAGPEPPVNRNLSDLHPEMAKKATILVYLCAAIGIPLLLTEGKRSHERQEWLYSIGRTHSHPVTGSEHILTKAKPGTSKHETGRAADFAPMDALMSATGQFRAVTNYNTPFWPQIGAKMKQTGLEWGGDFLSITDVPHAQLPDSIP